MSDVTEILGRVQEGDSSAASALLPLVYDELRKLAAQKMSAERPDHTLQATALVHDAFVKLVDTDRVQHWDSRGHFFSAAAEAMRRILVDSARAKQSRKRGGDRLRIEIDDFEASVISPPDFLLDLDETLRRLDSEDAVAAELVKLRLFAGLSVEEAGQMLGMSRATAYRTWEYVRSWFAIEMTENLQP